jgi:hypothetical protein
LDKSDIATPNRSNLSPLDLPHDPAAARYVKDETVSVEFALEAGALMSGEGLNHYAIGDALITSVDGARWVVARERFIEKYEAASTTVWLQDGAYRSRPIPVWAKQMSTAFSLARRAGGDVLHGDAGDWVMQYAPGDFGACKAARFAAVYRKVVDEKGE